jgi:two-component system KDP operon response regulator KdpE
VIDADETSAADEVCLDGISGVCEHQRARDESCVPASGVTRPNTSLESRAPRALVVDDDPEIRRALARLLRPELDVYLVGSVAQAEATLACIDRVDVAFVDWELPDGSGEQILERLANWPDAIRVLISARVVEMENPLENRALANLVLGKPLATDVVEALKQAALALPHG